MLNLLNSLKEDGIEDIPKDVEMTKPSVMKFTSGKKSTLGADRNYTVNKNSKEFT